MMPGAIAPLHSRDWWKRKMLFASMMSNVSHPAICPPPPPPLSAST